MAVSPRARAARSWPGLRVVLAAVALALLVPVGAAAAAEGPTPRIFGGEPADSGEYPFMVSLAGLNTDGHFCGGSLVAPDKVLTAAHCLANDPAGLVARVGGTSVTGDDAESIEVLSAQVHPLHDHDATIPDYDVAVLQLAEPAGATPIALAAPDGASERALWLSGARATAAGWGIDESFDLPDHLLEVALPVMSDAAGSAFYPGLFVPQTMVAAGVESGGVDICFGDSGGPLFVPGPDGPRQIGVSSWGFGCAGPGNPGIYARVAASPLYDWIRAIIDPVSHVADLNGDLVDDLVRVGDGIVEVAYSNGRSFGRPEIAAPVEPGSIVRFADADADFDEDMWVFSGGDLAVYGLQDGVFDEEIHLQDGVLPIGARPTVADLDGDLRADVAFGRTSTEGGFHYVDVLAWQGDLLTDTGLAAFGAGAAGQTILTGDVTADAIADLVVFNQDVVAPRRDVWSSRLFSFEEFSFIELVQRPEKLAGVGDTSLVGDFDGDGVADLGELSAGAARVVTAGVLGEESIWIKGFGLTGEVLVGDVDGDSRADLVNVTGNPTDDVVVARSTGRAFGPPRLWFARPEIPAL
jgi:trypsin